MMEMEPDDQSQGRHIPSNITKADSVEAIRNALRNLQEQDADVQGRLNTFIASQKTLAREIDRLDLMHAHLSSNTKMTRTISGSILSTAASTADRISRAVKLLDLEHDRVKLTLDVVEQVTELKACVLGVIGSMGAPQDWETAAVYLNRARKIPKEVVEGSFAEELVPTAEVPDPPKVTLENAAESLRVLFLREFEKAAQEGNGTKVTRFFKLFPLIGKSEVGLDIYGRYVCQGVASRARASLHNSAGTHERRETFFYANLLTHLFEHVAQIVESHGNLVEGHYGAGRMIKVVERLQLEADIQGGIIIETWNDERNIDRKLTETRSYAFTFLVQSFLPAQTTRAGTPRAGSPAVKVNSTETQTNTDDGVDMKDIDQILSEAALMLGRWSLYSRFIATKCQGDAYQNDGQRVPLLMPHLLLSSSLNKKIENIVILSFNVMTTFFLRRSVEKAFQLDEQPQGLSLNLSNTLGVNPPYITSAVDDVMYIVNQVLERSLSTSQRAVISNVVPFIARVLSSDFVGMIQRKMRDESFPKAAVQGTLPSEQSIISFVVLVNNLDIATEYVKRIVQTHSEQLPNPQSTNRNELSSSSSLSDRYPFSDDGVFVTASLKSLQHVCESKTSELINDGVLVLSKNVMKPRLRPALLDAFRDANYQITLEGITKSNHEVDDANGVEDNLEENVVQRQFQRSWDTITKPMARLLTERNYEKLLFTIISYLGEVLEKRIWSYYGRINDLGALHLERDVAGIVSVAVRGGRFGLRDAFARCTQICMVMNMEEDEWEELQSSSRSNGDDGIEWKLDSEERSRARAMLHDQTRLP